MSDEKIRKGWFQSTLPMKGATQHADFEQQHGCSFNPRSQ